MTLVQQGSYNLAAKAAQCLLNKFGANIGVDGDFGGGSNTAIRNFQSNMGIDSDGKVGATSWQYLFGYNTYPTPRTNGANIPNGQYLIKSKYSGYYLDVSADDNAGRVNQWAYNGGANQKWQVTYNSGKGAYVLQPQWPYYKDRSMVLDVTGGKDVNANMEVYPQGNNQVNQLFYFVPDGDGTYHIMSLLSPSRCLDVYGGSTTYPAVIDFYPWLAQPNQKWYLEPVSTSTGGTTSSTVAGETIYTNYSVTLAAALDKQMTCSPQISNGSNWVNATRAQVQNYLTPSNYSTGNDKYQFLDLSKSTGISENNMRSFLANKGILAGKENTYLSAASKYGVSEVYLAAHSCLETGNGTSVLAIGVIYNGTKVYNMYGIGAVDSDPIGQGSKTAYNNGWTTPELAIDGGAKWISQQYINATYKQNTLYKMRWNPAAPGTHQYATDVHWAIAQVNSIKSLYDNFPYATLSFDIPGYKA